MPGILLLQACKPSAHVCSASPVFPQFLYQAPPGAQQLAFPDFLMVPHLVHSEPILVASTPGIEALGQTSKESKATTSSGQAWDCILVAASLPLQACEPSVHVCPTFALPTPPQLLNQAPPGAQQLPLPDFLKEPHLAHTIVDVVAGVVTIDVVTMACFRLT